MKLTQEQAAKLKTLETMEEVDAFFKAERIELSPEDLDIIAGGWSILSPVKNAVKAAGSWVYDTMIDPAVDVAVGAGKQAANAVSGALGVFIDTQKKNYETVFGTSNDSLTAAAKEE